MEEAVEKLSQLTNTATKLIGKENYFSALDYLQVCEEVLDDAPDPEMRLLVLNNTAVCYQKIGRLEECLKYVLESKRLLDGGMLKQGSSNTPIKKQLQSIAQKKDLAAEVSSYKAYCNYTAQACALMSQLARHEDALELAKALMEDAKVFIHKLKDLCQEHSAERRFSSSGRLKKLIDASSALTSRPRLGREEVVEKAEEVLNYLEDFLAERGRVHAPDMSYRSALGIQKFNEWIFNFTIGTVMTVQILSPHQVKSVPTWESELSKDAMIKASSIVIVAYFCMATETRFIYSELGDIIRVKESKALHRRSIDLATSLLPLECPLVEHLKVSYNRNYAAFLDDSSTNRVSRLNISSLKHRQASKTALFASPLRSDRTKSRTITPIKSGSVERSMQRANRNMPGRFETSPYLKRVTGRKIALEAKRLLRPKYEASQNVV